MGPLPTERVTKSPPFSHTGVDFMGSIVVRSSNGEDCKRYVALFTCLVTRLVHPEMAKDLSAKSFILTLKRFIARRGVPLTIISDNGTNFQLTEYLLSNSQNSNEDSHLSLFLAEHRISWSFIPPSSPWMGGVWERMVGTVKRSLQKTIGRRKLNDELFQTTLCEVESVVNSRPLTTIGDQNSPCDALRPIDFIYKDVWHGAIQLSLDDNDDDPDFQQSPGIPSQKAAKEAISETEKITKKFWSIWRHEYLMELGDRHKVVGRKTRSSNQQPHIGDVVLLDDDSQQPRGQWPMAVIIELIKSRDGEIRSALLQNSAGRIVQRPISRLIPLEIQSSTQSLEEQNNRSSTIEKRATAQRKPASRLTKKEVVIRHQPPRAAKNQASYSEARSGFRSSGKSSTTTLVMIAMCALSLLNSVSTATISCSSKGAAIKRTHTAKAELCVNYKECKVIPEGDNATEVALPFEHIVSQHTIQWRTIIDSQQYTETIVCPAGDVCQKINCIMCTEFFGNPHCAPRMVIGIFAVCLAAIFAPLSLLCYVTGRQILFKRGWMRLKKTLKQRSLPKQQIKESLPMTTMSGLSYYI
ncbi:hypothetical protein V3C99_017998 [Haemonchus contortus]|uniref:Integrase catalytic domain-containing protein n=1 Tax=Haemonchus contortus TaxID=6289 RepID=A0A7I4Z3D6_HAECO